MMTITERTSPRVFDPNSFQNYFCENRNLILLANQHLVIQGIPAEFASSVMHGSVKSNSLVSLKPSAIESILAILSKMVHALGFTVSLARDSYTPKDREILWSLGNQFDLNSSVAITFKRSRGVIATHLSDLFQSMVRSSRLTLALAPQQWIELHQVPTHELSLDKPIYNFHKVAEKELPPGCKYRIFFKNPSKPICSSIDLEKQTLAITSLGQIEISLIHSSNYFTFSSFAKVLQKEGKFTLSDHQPLRFQDPSVPHFVREFKKYDQFFTPTAFFLNRLFLPIQMVVLECGDPLQLHIDGTCIEFISEGTTTLELGSGPLSMTISDLGTLLIANHEKNAQDSLRFKTNQPLQIYDIEKEEILKISSLNNPTSSSELNQSLGHIFFRRAPVGFIWRYHLPNYTLEPYVYERENQKCHVLQLTPNQSEVMLFWLIPLSANQGLSWMLNIFNLSSPKFLARFLADQSDSSVIFMEALAMKLILHYCTHQEFYSTVPMIFGIEIKDEIDALTAKYGNERLLELLSDIYDETLPEIDFRTKNPFMEIAPHFATLHDEESPHWHVENLPQETKALMCQLLAISRKTLSNQIFLASMGSVCEKISNGTCIPYLKEHIKAELAASSDLFS